MQPENRFLNRIKPKLNWELGWYIEKTHNAYRGGTPDWYVEWDGGSGWIEGKFWNIKTRPSVDSNALYNKCSALQQAWLNRAAQHKLPTAVLCGFPDTKVVAFMPLPIRTAEIEVITLDKLYTQLAAWTKHYL